ncbi:MAG TPA: urea ABC transporter substrate-binding protein [Tepidisphaeraceae bacterium]|nr:urea ABC transporter substrate-binding protein [Tepidisphaeraceae bacterium]
MPTKSVFAAARRCLFTAAAAAASVLTLAAPAHAQETVKVGVLHSLSGTMAISETSLKDVVLMAVDEINAGGGVLGKKIEPVVVDPASNWPLFAEKAKQLIVQDKVAVTFGCWTSVSRKSVLPVVEAKYSTADNPYGGGLLFYPVQYEGEEQSPNIFYTGASPNQQLIPAAEYMMSADGGSKKKFYLLGTDYVFPRTANKVLKAFLKSKGVPDANIAEEYTPFSHTDYQTIVGKVKEFAKDGDACVLSTINGDSNVPFYKEFANQGLTADKCPVVAFSVAEDELRSMETEKLVGHLAAWNYFQSIETPENKAFAERFKKFMKDDKRVTDDPIEAAYFGVYVWKNAVEKAGSFEHAKVVPAILGQEFDAPGGKKKMDSVNHHTHKPVLIGSIRADGQFDIVWQTEGLVKPDSFSTYLHSPDEIQKLTGSPSAMAK